MNLIVILLASLAGIAGLHRKRSKRFLWREYAEREEYVPIVAAFGKMPIEDQRDYVEFLVKRSNIHSEVKIITVEYVNGEIKQFVGSKEATGWLLHLPNTLYPEAGLSVRMFHTLPKKERKTIKRATVDGVQVYPEIG